MTIMLTSLHEQAQTTASAFRRSRTYHSAMKQLRRMPRHLLQDVGALRKADTHPPAIDDLITEIDWSDKFYSFD